MSLGPEARRQWFERRKVEKQEQPTTHDESSWPDSVRIPMVEQAEIAFHP
jgi:hypothetical protein